MRKSSWLGCVLMLTVAPGLAQARDYADPDGAFAVAVPADWQATRQPIPDLGVVTQLGREGDENPPLTVLVVTSEPSIAPAQLDEVANLLLGLARNLIQESGQILTEKTDRTKLADRDAVRLDLTYQGDGETWRGQALVVLGTRHALLLFITGPKDKPGVMQQAEAALATLAIEAATPRKASSGLFSRDNLAAVAARLKAGGLQPRGDEVLAAGEPPLTTASVMNFARLLSHVFGVELTETEYELTRQRFVEFYAKADAQGKAIIAQGAEQILASLLQGTEAEQAAKKEEAKTTFEQRFQAGAQAGIVWAQVLWEAIQRRGQVVVRAEAKLPDSPAAKPGDQEMSNADLDAAVELLYFLWVGAGRDPNVVTPEVVQQVRTLLAQGFPRFPPPFQALLANAEPLYSRVRAAWMEADDTQRAQLAGEFGAALDELGFKDPAAGGGGSAWDDVAGVDPSQLRAELVRDTCYNLAQKATGGAWGSR